MNTTPAVASTAPLGQPGVISWFKAFVFAQAVLGLAGLILGLRDVPGLMHDPEIPPAIAAAVVLFIFLLALAMVAAFLLPLFLRPRPWLWTYGIVLMCLGMMTLWFIPACVPLLVHWFKPATKAYFGKK